MKRRLLALSLAGILLGGSLGCATYRDDLQRSAEHYKSNRPDKALALLEVLEQDLDSLAEVERAQYAYYRGMSHFRLNQRYHARHWLGRSMAREVKLKGSLTGDEKQRVEDTLAELNKERYGSAGQMAAPTDNKCKLDSDCKQGNACKDGSCVEPAKEPPQVKSCQTDAECGDGEVCVGSACKAP